MGRVKMLIRVRMQSRKRIPAQMRGELSKWSFANILFNNGTD